jgi:hypothetical protein
VRLYQKGIKKQEEKERYCKQLREVEEMLEARELKFKPQLIAKGPPSNKPGGLRKEEELIMYGRLLQEKKEMARVINSQYEESKFDFVPKINRKSEQIVQERSRYAGGGVATPQEAGNSLHSPRTAGRNLEDQLRSIGMSNQVESPNVFFSPKNAGTKFLDLYDDARLRKERIEMVKKEMLDKECTFKPHLVTKESRATKSVLSTQQHQ